MVKLRPVDVAMIAIAAVILVVIAVFGFPAAPGSNDGDKVTTTLVIDFWGTAAPLNPGNTTTWEKVGGTWQATTEAHNDTVNDRWVLKNISSGANCYLQLLAGASIGGFAVVTDNQTLGMLVTSIAGLVNQEGGGPGWQYYVNEVYANRACNMVGVENGDIVEWKYRPLVG